MPMSYLLSGGVSMRSIVPGFVYRAIRFLERRNLRERGVMFALIEVRRT